MTIIHYYVNSTKIAPTLKKVLIELQSEVNDVIYKRTYIRSNADIIVYLKDQSFINNKCGIQTGLGLSCSVINKVPNLIYLSYDNWMSGGKSKTSIESYRTYLIKHEFLHCKPFYKGHLTPKQLRTYCDKSNPLPIMYQQTKGVYKKCINNTKVLKLDKDLS